MRANGRSVSTPNGAAAWTAATSERRASVKHSSDDRVFSCGGGCCCCVSLSVGRFVCLSLCLSVCVIGDGGSVAAAAAEG